MEKNGKESQYKVVIFNVYGLTNEDLKEAFAGYKVNSIRIIENSDKPFSSLAFVTFANPDEQQKALNSRIVAKNRKLKIKPFKVKDQKKEASEIAMIKQTVDINEQKVLAFDVKGHSSDKIIDLSERKLNFKFVIKNKTMFPKEIIRIIFQSSSKFFKCSAKIRLPRTLKPFSNLEIDVTFEHQLKEPASCFTTLTVQTDKFCYPYPLTFNVSSLDDMQLIAKKGEYKEQDDLIAPENIIRAPPIEKASKTHVHTKGETFYVVSLDLYPVPESIHKAIMEKDTFYDFNPWRAKEQWKQRLHQLLWFEEVELEKKSHRFDLRNVSIPQLTIEDVLDRQYKGRLDAQLNYSEIAVPGLADNRPSVLYNDYVLVWLAGTTDHAYEGRVVFVKEKSIVVLFDQSFHQVFQSNSQFNVRFRFDRLQMRVWHRAIDTIDLQYLWPVGQSEAVQQNQIYLKQDIQWHDKQISQNPEQVNAIVNLLNKTNGSAPFLLFGPFGTGKTKCLIEYARQVLLLEPDCRILICAHSNSGTNKICEELMKTMSNKELFRVFAFNANPNRLGDIRNYTLRDEERGIFIPPSMEILRSYRVVVSTGDNAALLHGIGIGSKHFTHILVDEAAEFSEPNICVPLCLASKETTVVLAGDSKQTSPRIFSRIAKHHGLAKSLMERLSSESLYKTQNGKANPKYCANLVRNYRSHPAILEFLSAQFYDNTLICSTKPQEFRALEQWDKMDTEKTFPFLFYALDNSKEDREANSPSYFNIDEAITIAKLISNLLRKFGRNLRQQDICVVSASRKQTEKIIDLMKAHGMGGVEVGTTEFLQGREFKAIFISTVRSSVDLLEFDHQHNIGFVADEKRFNTAISRAVALVVVVGNSRLLGREPMWRNFIQYCSANDSYVNLMNGAVTGEEMIQELIDEEEEKKKQAELEEKEAKRAAYFEKKRLAQSSSESKVATDTSTQPLNKSDGAAAPKINLPFSVPKQLPSLTNGNAAEHGHVHSNGNVAVPNPQLVQQNGYYPQVHQPHAYIPPAFVQQQQQVHVSQPQLQAPTQYSMFPQQVHYQQHNGQATSYPQVAHVEQQWQAQLGGQAQVPQPGHMQNQQQLQQLQSTVQTNGHDEDAWIKVDKAKSVTLSRFMDKDLLVAFKDKGLKGYPPFTVARHVISPDAMVVTFYVIGLDCLASGKDRLMIFDFFSMQQNPVMISAANLIPFDAANMSNNSKGQELLSRLRLNVPDGYDWNVTRHEDRIIVVLFPTGTVTFGRTG